MHFFGRFVQMPLVVANTDGQSRMGKKHASEIKSICKLTDEDNEWIDVILAKIEPNITIKGSFPRLAGDTKTDRQILAVGYGSAKLSHDSDEAHGKLLMKYVRIVDNGICDLLHTKRANKRNMFCAKGHKLFLEAGGKERGHSCTHDAGGAMVRYVKPVKTHPDGVSGMISNLDYERPCMRYVVVLFFLIILCYSFLFY